MLETQVNIICKGNLWYPLCS